MKFDISCLQPKEQASFALRALYEAAGCRKYHMGRFEEYGLYQENRSFLSSEQVITFTDLDGRLLALKPDVTLSIAKTAQPAPGETLRYYYHENVYRPSAESHTFQEIGQMGLELLGEVGETQVRQAAAVPFDLTPGLAEDIARSRILDAIRAEFGDYELLEETPSAEEADGAVTLTLRVRMLADIGKMVPYEGEAMEPDSTIGADS